MRKSVSILLSVIIVLSLFMASCGSGGREKRGDNDNTLPEAADSGENVNEADGEPGKEQEEETGQGSETGQETTEEVNGGDETLPEDEQPVEEIDYEKIRPNENGQIMIVMFHNFIKEYKSGDKEYTTTFDAFRKLLETLYEKGYRLISMSDYINNNIDVPAGTIPMVFTFDDGTAGQFNLIEENGELKVNPESAVGIMEEFCKTHPDFGLKGTFYVNLGNSTFAGAGTLAERLKYLIDKGFEIGNHTLTHVNLKTDVKTAEDIQAEIGGNQKKMLELVPGYIMNSFSLPYGTPAEDLKKFVFEGQYEDIKYENKAIMEVGANPAPSPVDVKLNLHSVPRVRASGIEPVDCDLEWWLKNLSRSRQYVSDGNPDTVAVPEGSEKDIDLNRLNGKKLVTYSLAESQ